MGEVYEVEHTALGQRAALKLLPSTRESSQKAVARFKREARAMAKLSSAYVTRITDYGELEGGSPYFVMELLRGHDLARLLADRGRLGIHEAVRIAFDACRGLKAVHAASLVHRDIKPANLFLTQDDSGALLCKLLDFGVTKSYELTQSADDQRLVGTLRYMAPEQVGEGIVDARTDLYALCAVLYEAISGITPHGGDRVERVLLSIMNEEPLPLLAVREGVPEPLSNLVARGLSRDPRLRFQNASELADALQGFVETVPLSTVPRVTVPPATVVPGSGALTESSTSGGRAKPRWWPILGGIGLLSLLGALSYSLVASIGTRSTELSGDSKARVTKTGSAPPSAAPHVPGQVEAAPVPHPPDVPAATDLDGGTVSGSVPPSTSGFPTRARGRPSVMGSPLLRVPTPAASAAIDPKNPYGTSH